MAVRRCDTLSLRISEALDRERRIQGKTYRAMTAATGISPAAQSGILDGHTARTSTLARYAEGLDCDIEVTIKPRPKRGPVLTQKPH